MWIHHEPQPVTEELPLELCTVTDTTFNYLLCIIYFLVYSLEFFLVSKNSLAGLLLCNKFAFFILQNVQSLLHYYDRVNYITIYRVTKYINYCRTRVKIEPSTTPRFSLVSP